MYLGRDSQDDIPAGLEDQWKKEIAAVRIYEEPGAFGLSVASINEATSEPETFEERYSYMEKMETREQREGEEQ